MRGLKGVVLCEKLFGKSVLLEGPSLVLSLRFTSFFLIINYKVDLTEISHLGFDWSDSVLLIILHLALL